MTTILLVEDEPVLAETLSYNLEHEGHRVLVARDGVQALELARQQQPDLLILDVMLPHLDGFSVCRILRDESDVPIVMLTARHDAADVAAGFADGASDYLTKPFSPAQLRARVASWLLRAEGHEGSSALGNMADAG